MMNRKLAGIYLNDHLAGAIAGLELAKRAESSNRGSDLGRFLSGLVVEIESDRDSLREVMGRLDIPADRAKTTFAWLVEKLGRLKLNGQLWSYSPLSRVVEIEALWLGVQGKLSMWRALQRFSETERSLAAIDFDRLVARARSQLRALERQRLKAVDQALEGSA
jgi:hypothetical protein